MCGINGIFSNSVIPNIEKRITKMNDSIIHRGPDAEGVFLKNGNIALGHRRLKIIDLSESANQPFIGHFKKYAIVFNGEIYNFKEIKSQINYPFKTKSDTEVIVAAFETKGIDWFLNIANGMFAIGAIDFTSDKLILIRDRLGIKPLYYTKTNSSIIFSSEIKGILASGLVEASFNEDAIDEYLANRYIREPYSFFQNIYQVEAGWYIEFDNKLNRKNIKYWELPRLNLSENYDTETEIINIVEEKLFNAINIRLVSDVNLGTYLSGGIDSSLITAIVAQIKKEKINTYTIGFKEEGYNEFEYSRLAAEKENTNHHEILMSNDDYMSKIEKLICFKDAPLGVPNEVPLAEMSSILKEKITVVLSGEGADELFGGYGRIFRSYFDYENLSTDISFYNFFINKYDYVPRNIRDNFLTTSKKLRLIFDKRIKSDFGDFKNEENIFRFFHQYHLKGLLQRLDSTTMHTAVEGRVPFVDHELIEYVYLKVPHQLKLKWLNNNSIGKAKTLIADNYSEILDSPKYILKQVALKHIPKEIVERKKVGFPVPLDNWIRDIEYYSNETLRNVDWLKKGSLNNLLKDIRTTPRTGQILWMFLNVELFRKNYFYKNYKW